MAPDEVFSTHNLPPRDKIVIEGQAPSSGYMLIGLQKGRRE